MAVFYQAVRIPAVSSKRYIQGASAFTNHGKSLLFFCNLFLYVLSGSGGCLLHTGEGNKTAQVEEAEPT